jgi:predicted nucleic acid-binding Zn ribbon protein
VSQTAKNSCPACGAKFRTGGLLPAAELTRLQKVGIINLGEPADQIDCPKCQAKLKVVAVRMGTFFQMESC